MKPIEEIQEKRKELRRLIINQIIPLRKELNILLKKLKDFVHLKLMTKLLLRMVSLE